MHGSEGLEELFQFRFRPGPRDLSHKHLDGVRVGLVQMLQRPGHLDAVAIAAGTKTEINGMVAFTSRLQANDKTNKNNENQTAASISFHQLLRCLRLRYSFVSVIIIFQL